LTGVLPVARLVNITGTHKLSAEFDFGKYINKKSTQWSNVF